MPEQSNKRSFIPALGFQWFTRFYDPLVHWTTREKVFKSALLEQAGIQNGQTVLDLACGTATLTIAIKQKFPAAIVHGIDVDAKILEMAKRKTKDTGVEILFEEGFSDALPYADKTFDRVVSTLFFHHINRAAKIKTLDEICRVLKIGGELHIADFGAPQNALQHLLSHYLQIIDSVETTVDNLEGQIPFLIKDTGFAQVERTAHFKTMLGTIRLFKAVKAK